jgi:hypothetical protein
MMPGGFHGERTHWPHDSPTPEPPKKKAQTMTTLTEGFKVGQRVELHPCTDEWMMGARFGEVRRVADGRVWVKLDKIRKVLAFHPDNILSHKNRNP